MATAETTGFELLNVSGIKKSFGENQVLKDIRLTCNKGEVLALIGGNGAGKSTLMKVIMGIYQPDEGEMVFNGEKVCVFQPIDSLHRGIYMVPQEPMLFPNMSVLENIIIGFSESKTVLLKKLKQIMNNIGWHLSLERKALTLSIAEQQIVELLRGMMRDAKLLILDEPTSALTFDEVEQLFKTVRTLREKNVGIIYITHRLAEVFEICSDVAIMRDGRIIRQDKVGCFTRDNLLEALLPENVEKNNDQKCGKVDYAPENIVLEVKEFSGYGFENIHFKVYKGEILGIAGLVGAGRTELVSTIYGREKVLHGHVYLKGRDITSLSTAKVIDAGINYVTEDRRLAGLFGICSVAANTTSALLKGHELGKFFLNRKKEGEITDLYIHNFNTVVTDREQEAGSLSGGNQQKIVISRALSTMPKVVILDEPTRGIDAGARKDVYHIIRQLRAKGVAILLISSDMEEIVELSDRAIVMYQGHQCKCLKREEIDPATLMNASFGIGAQETCR